MDEHEARQALDRKTEAGVIGDLARHTVPVAQRIIDTKAGRFIVLQDANADGNPVERLERLDPEGGLSTTVAGRIAGVVTLQTAASLAGYVNRYKTATSKAALFADIDRDSITAVLDFHESSKPVVDDIDNGPVSGVAGFGEHVAKLDLPRSQEWQTWTGADGKLKPQLEFVRFLEENREDITSPDAATILEACRDLTSRRKVHFDSVVREDSDNYSITYEEETTAGTRKGDLNLPSGFTLSIPVYFGGEEVQVEALLRWKLDDGVLLLGVKLKRAERIRQEEFHRVVDTIGADTGVDAFYGRRG
jgi:uncharacterized protein YfdQ (DUF2303 family)